MRHLFDEIGKRRETRVAGAAVVERAISQESELGAVICEFIDLTVIQFDGPGDLRRLKELEAGGAQTAVCGEAWVCCEPARDSGRAEAVAVARGQATAGFLQRISSVVGRHGFKDFGQRVCLVTQGAGAGREIAPAGPAAIKPDSFKLLRAAPLWSDLLAVARRTAVGSFDGQAADVGVGGTGHDVRVAVKLENYK